MKHFKLNNLKLLLSEIYWNKGSNCCFTGFIRKLWYSHAFGCLWIDLIQTWYSNRYYCTLHFDTSLIGLDLYSRSLEHEEAKTSSQSFQSVLDGIWFTIETFVGVMYLLLMFCVSSIFKGDSLTYVICTPQKKKNPLRLACKLYSDIYRPTSSKLSVMIKTTKLYIVISFWMTLTFIKGLRFNGKNSADVILWNKRFTWS